MPVYDIKLPKVREKLSEALYKRDNVNDQILSIPNHAIQRFIQRPGRSNIRYIEAEAEICKCLNVNTRKYRYIGKENNAKNGITYYYLGKYKDNQYVILVSYLGLVHTVLTLSMARYTCPKLIDEYFKQYYAMEKEILGAVCPETPSDVKETKTNDDVKDK